MRVGFGDDVAAGAGRVHWTADGPIPIGNAPHLSALLGCSRLWQLTTSAPLRRTCATCQAVTEKRQRVRSSSSRLLTRAANRDRTWSRLTADR
jgi:hypothetical protein